MFDRFTDDAKNAMSRSRLEAMRLHHECIDVQHMLLALLRMPEEPAAGALSSLGVDCPQLVAAIEALLEPGRASNSGQLPFTPQGKVVLMRTMECASELGHNFIDSGHLLFGAVAAAAGPMQAALQAGGLQLTTLRTALADATRREYTSAMGAPFDLENATAILATLSLQLGDLANAAVRDQNIAAAEALRELRQHLAATLTKLRELGSA